MNHRIETFKGSKHFRLKQVADGVYAAISIPGTGSLGNAAIIDLGDKTLVTDTFYTLNAAQDLKEAAEHLTGRSASYVFNTHWHADHTNGNQVFSSTAQMISTSKTREIMATFLKERIAKQLLQPEVLSQAVDSFEEMMKQETDEKLKMEMEWDIATEREYMKMLPDLVQTIPTITFDQEMSIYGSHRTVKLITLGGGHTQSDAFLYMPEERIALMGDLVLSMHHPVMMYANPQEWLQILDQVESLGVETILPGHGEVCSLNDLHQVRGYITNLIEIVREIVQNKGSIEDIPVPDAYRAWHFTGEFKTNLKKLYDLMSSKNV